MKQILARNNFHLLDHFNSDEFQITFNPRINTHNQLQFYKFHFHELQKLFPHLIWLEDLASKNYDLVLSWDAVHEKRSFGNLIYPAQNRLLHTLPFEMPESFTPFKNLAMKHLPEKFPNAKKPFSETINTHIHDYFWVKKLPHTYLETRNKLTGKDSSTRFSTYLSAGFLDVRYLFNEVKEFEKHEGASESSHWIIYELLWREFFYWHYHRYPRHYFSKNGLKNLNFSSFKTWEIPELIKISPHPFFKSALAELSITGHLSNRARQIFASVWINDLQIDWRGGAALFEKYLIDFDVFSNYGNWMYLAGVGVDPRGKRYFNVDKQLQTYDPEGEYIKMWNYAL